MLTKKDILYFKSLIAEEYDRFKEEIPNHTICSEENDYIINILHNLTRCFEYADRLATYCPNESVKEYIQRSDNNRS